VVGRVRIITSLWRTGDDRTLPLLSLTKWTKSSVEKLSGKSEWAPFWAPKGLPKWGEKAPLVDVLRYQNRADPPLRLFSRQFLEKQSKNYRARAKRLTITRVIAT
jgi:hypothetical protein